MVDQAQVIAGMVTGLDTTLGFEYDLISGDGSSASFEVGPQHLQPFGLVHGGTYSALVESLASVSAAMWLRERGVAANVVGVNNSTDFLRAVRSGRITGTAIPIHRGRLQQLWQVDMTDADGRVVAQGRVRLQNLPSGDS